MFPQIILVTCQTPTAQPSPPLSQGIPQADFCADDEELDHCSTINQKLKQSNNSFLSR